MQIDAVFHVLEKYEWGGCDSGCYVYDDLNNLKPLSHSRDDFSLCPKRSMPVLLEKTPIIVEFYHKSNILDFHTLLLSIG